MVYGSEWSWTASNGTATDQETVNAYQAVTDHGLLTDFSYKVWNDMVKKVNDVMYTKGVSWENYGGITYEQTKMTSAAHGLTTARFNSLRHNIHQNYATAVPYVSSGDIVRGWYFIDLMACVNHWSAS